MGRVQVRLAAAVVLLRAERRRTRARRTRRTRRVAVGREQGGHDVRVPPRATWTRARMRPRTRVREATARSRSCMASSAA